MDPNILNDVTEFAYFLPVPFCDGNINYSNFFIIFESRSWGTVQVCVVNLSVESWAHEAFLMQYIYTVTCIVHLKN